MSLTDQSPQRQEATRTPGLARLPKGQFDAQAALRALEADDEEGLVAALKTVNGAGPATSNSRFGVV